jgi:F0F1-type ATP synthase assembly protein I
MESNKKQSNKWLALINIPFQMGLIILIGMLFGRWLDEKFENENVVYTIIFSLLAVFLSLYNVIRQVKSLNDDSKK